MHFYRLTFLFVYILHLLLVIFVTQRCWLNYKIYCMYHIPTYLVNLSDYCKENRVCLCGFRMVLMHTGTGSFLPCLRSFRKTLFAILCNLFSLASCWSSNTANLGVLPTCEPIWQHRNICKYPAVKSTSYRLLYN